MQIQSLAPKINAKLEIVFSFSDGKYGCLILSSTRAALVHSYLPFATRIRWMQLPEPQKPLIKIGHNRGGSELIRFKILFTDFLSPVAFINATVSSAFPIR